MNGLKLHIVGAILLGAGLILTNAAGQKAEVTRAATEGYTTNWEATSLLVAKHNENSDRGDAIIGVAGWKVMGSMGSGSTFFKETWSVPASRPMFVGSRGQDNGRVVNWAASGFNLGDSNTWQDIPTTGPDWLVGRLVSHTTDFRNVKIDTVPVGGTVVKREGSDTNGTGYVSSCIGDGTCLFTNGTYGFEESHDWQSASNGKAKQVGVAIPLRWNVQGTICDTQAECQ